MKSEMRNENKDLGTKCEQLEQDDECDCRI
jgi:hypothetical protein